MPLVTSRGVAVGVAVMTVLACTVLQSRSQPDGVVDGDRGSKPSARGDQPRRIQKRALTRVSEPPVVHKLNTAKKSVIKPNKTAIKRPQPIREATVRVEPDPIQSGTGKPAIIATKELMDFEKLPAGRQRLIATAIALAKNSPWMPYSYGGADPALGGLDCSGAMYFVMTRIGLTPPRTSAGQYEWLRVNRRLHIIPEGATTTDHRSLAWLLPGDLLFWSTPAAGADTQIVNITHVAMYLGRESKDGWQIMINATDGRTYRGTKANGYGVYDFRMPREGSASKMVGYGLPPGIPEIIPPVGPPLPDVFLPDVPAPDEPASQHPSQSSNKRKIPRK